MKKNLRKTLALLLAGAMSLALLSGCNGDQPSSSDAGSSQPPSSNSAAPGGAKDSATLATSGEPTRFFPCGAEGSNGNDSLNLDAGILKAAHNPL